MWLRILILFISLLVLSYPALLGQESEEKPAKIKIRRQGAAEEKVAEEKEEKIEKIEEKKTKVSLRHGVKGDVEPKEPTPPIEYGKHSILVGGRLAMTVTSATTPNGAGSAISPDFGARGEYVHQGLWLALLDLGYTQSRLKVLEDPQYNPQQTAIIRADYIKTALLGGARYGLGNLKFPRFLANKSWLKPFVVYANAGFYFNFLLSTEIEITSNLLPAGPYDYSPYANAFVFGLQSGVGIEMQVWRLMTFVDFSYSRALSDNFKRTMSLVFVTGPIAEHNFIINLGAKYQVYNL